MNSSDLIDLFGGHNLSQKTGLSYFYNPDCQSFYSAGEICENCMVIELTDDAMFSKMSFPTY